MNLASFREWLRKVYETQDGELDCEDVFEILPRYVDLDLAGEEPAKQFPKISQHLAQCPRCRDLYEGVRDAAQAEQGEESVQPGSISVEVEQRMSTPPV